MTKLNAFIKLDFMTVKPYLKGKNLLIFAVLSILIAFDSAGIINSLYVGSVFAFMFIGFSFTLSEKNSMDALYPTLGVNKKTVVCGRYIFTVILCLGAVMAAVVPSVVRILFLYVQGVLSSDVNIFVPFVTFVSFIILTGAVLLPIYFKCGYSKAKFAIMFPIIIMFGVMALFKFIAGDSGTKFINSLPEMLSTFLTDSPLGVVILALALILVLYVSYNLSLAFYKKREF